MERNPALHPRAKRNPAPQPRMERNPLPYPRTQRNPAPFPVSRPLAVGSSAGFPLQLPRDEAVRGLKLRGFADRGCKLLQEIKHVQKCCLAVRSRIVQLGNRRRIPSHILTFERIKETNRRLGGVCCMVLEMFSPFNFFFFYGRIL